jgi:uncharacterized protein YbaP (TraB family)
MKLRRIALPLLFVAACAPAQPSPAPRQEAAKVAHPALWKLADEDTTIYLFGTIHVLPKGYAWESPRLKQVVGEADGLVIETVLADDPTAMATMLLQMGRATNLPPLLDRVPPAKKAALQSVIARSGVPASLLDGMKTWTAGMMLVAVTLTDIGADAQSGVEQQLKNAFAGAGKPIEGLEKPEQQLGFLDSLSEPDQRAFLESVVDSPEESRKDFARMLAAWSRGDDKAISATFDKEADMTPKLRQTLLYGRNAGWASWLKQRLDKPGTVLVAVGAGHLAGKGSVQDQLAAKGLKVSRVE